MMARRLLRDESGSAAEFALVLPLLILFLFGIIDGGRYLWEVNQAEKATQAGARAAAVTSMIPAGLIDYSFSVDGGVPQGVAVAFPTLRCTSSGATPNCIWQPKPGEEGAPVLGIDLRPNGDAFNNVITRMRAFMPTLEAENVVITYSNSGLGFAGDPNGPDVAPIITVELREMQFEPILTTVFGVTIGIPNVPYSISQEDGQGECFEEDLPRDPGPCPS